MLISVSPSHSPDWSSESLPVLRLELHEPQVVLPAHLVCPPLPQRVRRYQHPQWLLRALKLPAVTTHTSEYTHCAGFPAWERCSPKLDGGHFQRNQRIIWSTLCCGWATWSWILPCLLSQRLPQTSSPFFVIMCAGFLDDYTDKPSLIFFFVILDTICIFTSLVFSFVMHLHNFLLKPKIWSFLTVTQWRELTAFEHTAQ